MAHVRIASGARTRLRDRCAGVGRGRAADLDTRSLEKGTPLVWFATDVDDGLITNCAPPVPMKRATPDRR
jgi:hypothetical protein